MNAVKGFHMLLCTYAALFDLVLIKENFICAHIVLSYPVGICVH